MTTSTIALVDVDDVRARVDAVLSRHVSQLRTVLAAASDDADRLADAVAQMLSGGKRLRAAFCYWSWRAHGGQPGGPESDAVIRVGAAVVALLLERRVRGMPGEIVVIAGVMIARGASEIRHAMNE